MVSNTTQGVLNHKPGTSGSSLERTCPRGTPLPGPPHAMDGQRCGNSATTGWRSGQPRQQGERGFHSVFPGLVDPSTKSILLIVSLQACLIWMDARLGSFMLSQQWEHWEEWGLNNASLCLQGVPLGQGQFCLLWPYKEAWSLARVKIIYGEGVSLS